MQLSSVPRPRFRTDLVAECIEAEGQRFIDVIDPDTGDAFRFYEVEYSLACAMDGERDVQGLAAWAREELGLEPSRAELENVITTLGDLGYLERGTRAAARAEMDVELAPGVTHARPEPMPIEHADYELGRAGGTPTTRMNEMVEDVELGLPGQGAAVNPATLEAEPSMKRGPTRPDADEDGPTHLPPASVGDFDDDEVSVDLSEHLSLKPDDVKEAVRMSRSMKVVEVPPELLDEIGQKEAEAAQRAKEMRDAAERAIAPAPAVEEKLPPMREPVELPEKPVVVSRKSATAPAEKRPAPAEVKPVAPVEQPSGGGTSKVLIAFLVLAILGAGGFYLWKYVINKPKADDAAETQQGKGEGTGTGKGTSEGTGATAGTGKGTGVSAGTGAGTSEGTGATAGTGEGTGTGTAAVPSTPPPFATLELRGDAVEVKGGEGGSVAFAVEEGAEVQEGDPIVQYKGASKILIAMGSSKKGLLYDVETRYPEEIKEHSEALAKAQAKGDKKAEAKAQRKLEERTKRLEFRKGVLDNLKKKLAEYTISAPTSGKVVMAVKKGGYVKDDAVVAKIETSAALVAAFDMTGQPSAPAVGDSVRIANKDTPDQKANCQVSAVEGTNVAVSCAADIGIPAGTIVVLER